MRKSAPALEVRPKWARAWAGVNESIKTFNEGEAKAEGGEGKGRRREGGVPKKGWGREVGVAPSEAGIAIRGLLPRESHQRRAELRGSSASAAGGRGGATMILMDALGGEILGDVEADGPVVLSWVEFYCSRISAPQNRTSCIRGHDADAQTFLSVLPPLLQSGRCCYCWSQNFISLQKMWCFSGATRSLERMVRNVAFLCSCLSGRNKPRGSFISCSSLKRFIHIFVFKKKIKSLGVSIFLMNLTKSTKKKPQPITIKPFAKTKIDQIVFAALQVQMWFTESPKFSPSC